MGYYELKRCYAKSSLKKIYIKFAIPMQSDKTQEIVIEW